MKEKFCLAGRFSYEIRSKHGLIIEYGEVKNGIVIQGLTEALNILFGATSKNAALYVGLIADATTVTLSPSNTMASHSGWTEATGYTSATRPALTFGTAANAAIATSGYVTLTANATADVAGFFITTENTKGGANGTLWCTALFGETASSWKRSLYSGMTLKVGYTLTAAGSEV